VTPPVTPPATQTQLLEGFDPYKLIHAGPVTSISKAPRYREVAHAGPGNATAPGQSPTSLSLTPDTTVCSFGEDGIAIKSDGQLLFAEFVTQETTLEFGEKGCETMAAFPEIDVQ